MMVRAAELNRMLPADLVRAIEGELDLELPRLPKANRQGIIKSLSDAKLRKCFLPKGFCFLATETTIGLEVVEPVLLYLHYKVYDVRELKPPVGNSQEGYCAELYEWWNYLELYDIRWDEVTPEDVIEYAEVLSEMISPITHRPYDPSTIRRRIAVILDFYSHAFDVNWIDYEINKKTTRRAIRAGDDDPLAHIHSESGETESSDLLPGDDAGRDVVDAFDPMALHLTLNDLGPVLPDRPNAAPSGGAIRDRLVAELQLHTGMRPDEVLSLVLYQILALKPKGTDPFNTVPLEITKTKGLLPRTIQVPTFLVWALHWYVDNERKAALNKAKRCGKFRKREPMALFLNGLEANNRDVGEPYQYSSYRRCFKQAMFDLGMTHEVLHTDPDTGEQYMAPLADHTPHDLRHTFALIKFFEIKDEGEADPYKKLQVLLGHKYRSTTVEIYLRSVQAFEKGSLEKMMLSFFDQMAEGQGRLNATR